MSNIGNNPKVQWLNLAPRSTDPTNPEEGDIFYSDGTPRLEGPWVYQNAAWQQFSTGAALTTVNNLTFTPQSADPGSPTTGMMFYSDGTARAAGIWVYNGTGWVQMSGERQQTFTQKTRFDLHAASTANVIIASEVENGDTLDGVVLATNDYILLKDQTTTSENGVYIVQASGAALRAPEFDDASELSYAHIKVNVGTANGESRWYQQNLLSTLGDAQSWTTSPPSYTFTVPQGVYALQALLSGGGGGGGGTPSGTSGNQGGGGGGGAGAVVNATLPVTPGDTLTVQVGIAGHRGLAGGGAATDGSAGGDSSLSVSGSYLHAQGGGGGGRAGNNPSYASGAGGAGILGAGGANGSLGGGGGGSWGAGGASAGGSAGGAGTNLGGGGAGGAESGTHNGGAGGTYSIYTSDAGAAGGTGQSNAGGGGGGATGYGGIGGTGGNGIFASPGFDGNSAPTGNYGAGGGGAGGTASIGPPGRYGGFGENGIVILSW